MKCSKIKTARVKHAKQPPFYFVKYANLRRSCRGELWHQWARTSTEKPQIKNLIGRVRKNKRAARAARTYEQVRAALCKTTTKKLPHLLMTT